MSELTRRISQIEQITDRIMPTTCPRCQGKARPVFPDEPTNVGGYPYGESGRCPMCGKPPVTKTIELSKDQRRAFEAIPWSIDPMRRYRQKIGMMLAVWRAHAERNGDVEGLNILARMKDIETVDHQLDWIFAGNGDQPCRI